MMNINNNRIQVKPPKNPKKITGTRFAAVLGMNPWKTPFEAWCEITRTYEEPFEDTKHTIAGKIIEPKQIEYLKTAYFMEGIKTPTDVYGENYFNKTWGDFFKDSKIFGGMWDALNFEDNKLKEVIECKFTSRSEDWLEDIPLNYLLQNSLYSYLLNTDNAIMLVSFSEEKDYVAPEEYKVSSENTTVLSYKISEKFEDFTRYIAYCHDWWEAHVVTGISPEYDEVKDAKILKELRKNTVSPDASIREVLAEAEQLLLVINKAKESISEETARFDVLKDQIKAYAESEFRSGDTHVRFSSDNIEWVVGKSIKKSIDTTALKNDGLLDKYQKSTVTLTLKSKEIESCEK